ncbi:hypothetical protein NWQ34_01135 [Mycoplasmopsis felis]|uniref:hypothetical protein n=1 Tax=Mycoplasmopsis felis TaxID=33923 RepID=UPI0021DFE1C6|nr:hypothetical protein [Mycoplasmopsis felis]MCU9938315.1 hypothetical protein [Mycoplasmopsis felis]
MIITISLETTSHSNSTLWNRIYIPQHLSNTYIKWVEAYNNSPDLLNLLTVSTKENLPLEQQEWFDVLNQGSIPGEISSLKDYINQGTMYKQVLIELLLLYSLLFQLDLQVLQR